MTCAIYLWIEKCIFGFYRDAYFCLKVIEYIVALHVLPTAHAFTLKHEFYS